MSSASEYHKDDGPTARCANALGMQARVAIRRFRSLREKCFSGHMYRVLSIAKAAVPQYFSELKDIGLMQGQTASLVVRYRIDRKKRDSARKLMTAFIADIKNSSYCCE